MSRAEENDLIRKTDSLYEIDDPRAVLTLTMPTGRFSADEASGGCLRRYDNRSFTADAPLEATYYNETPRDRRVVEFDLERTWRERGRVTSLAARFTTELGALDPKDEGFLLWFPVTALDVLSHVGDHYIVALDTRLYDRWEIEDLVPREPKGARH